MSPAGSSALKQGLTELSIKYPGAHLMIGPYLFLDIDGVLNHGVLDNGYRGICSLCAKTLNGVLERTKARLVIASAWRYYVLRGEMSLAGFQALLCSHGVAFGTVVDVLGKDDDRDMYNRGALIRRWFQHRHGFHKDTRYVAVDDHDLGYTQSRTPFVQVAQGLCQIDTSAIEDHLAPR
jgi:hypothetical protein